MKMSDVFNLPVNTKLKFTGDKSNEFTPDVVLIDGHYKLNGTECDAVELAINTHDRLEQENAELREALRKTEKLCEDNYDDGCFSSKVESIAHEVLNK